MFFFFVVLCLTHLSLVFNVNVVQVSLELKCNKNVDRPGVSEEQVENVWARALGVNSRELDLIMLAFNK